MPRTVGSPSPRRYRAALTLVVLLTAGVVTNGQSTLDLTDLKAANDRANALRRSGEVIAARTILLAVVDQATARGDKAMLQRAFSLLADVHINLSDWAAVLDYAQRAYDVMPDPAGRPRMELLIQTGRVYQELREGDRSRAAYLEAEALAKAANDLTILATVYNELGLLTWRVERNKDEAIRYYDLSIALAEKAGDPRGMMIAYNSAGNVFRVSDLEEAERRYRAGMAAGRRAGINEEVLLLKNMGIVYRETGRHAEARQSLERAVVLADERGAVRTSWQARMELGTLYARTDPTTAADYYEQTLRGLEGLNNDVLLEGFRAGALSGSITIQDDPYDLYTDLLLSNGKEREAFHVAERARARTFLDTLSFAREEIANVLPKTFIEEERALLGKINASQAALRAPGLAAARRAALDAEIRDTEERLTQIRVRLSRENPALAHARYPEIWGVDDVQRRLLQPNEVLLQYFVGAQATTLWAITSTDVHVRRLPPRSAIEPAVRAFIETIGRPDTDYRGAAKALGHTLLPDLDGILAGATRFIVVPHGILNYVPFEALIDQRDRFLVLDHAIFYSPSTSSLGFLRSRQSSGTQVMAVGNAVMRDAGAATERGQSFARIGALKELPHSGPEVRAVARVYGSAARVYEQHDATELVFSTPEASRAGIIHIATHGLIDEDLPERSGLALSAASRSDGILQMREVYSLRLNAALVTLSACQTALGKSVTGEGMIGLSRAFFYAGSNAVLASLWNVNDASTEQLMRPFYRSLAAGRAIDESLRDAKLELIGGGGRLSHPYYWAAFVVTGHGSASVPVRPGWSLTSGALGLAMAGVLLAGALVWRRVR
jgi:CHAT domain-containing protein